jgi:mono/diheme cytochrome c family protein
LDVLWALLLIGVAVFLGGILFRRVPSSWLAIGAVLVVFGFGIPALVIDDHKSESAAGAGASEESGGGGGEAAGGGEETGGGGGEQAAGGGGGGGSAEGKLIFTQSCGTCHTLSDAGTNGQVGPNLDQLKPNKQRVQTAIKNGGAGSGTMPANIVTGKEAQDVADYVSSVAGK